MIFPTILALTRNRAAPMGLGILCAAAAHITHLKYRLITPQKLDDPKIPAPTYSKDDIISQELKAIELEELRRRKEEAMRRKAEFERRYRGKANEAVKWVCNERELEGIRGMRGQGREKAWERLWRGQGVEEVRRREEERRGREG